MGVRVPTAPPRISRIVDIGNGGCIRRTHGPRICGGSEEACKGARFPITLPFVVFAGMGLGAMMAVSAHLAVTRPATDVGPSVGGWDPFGRVGMGLHSGMCVRRARGLQRKVGVGMRVGVYVGVRLGMGLSTVQVAAMRGGAGSYRLHGVGVGMTRWSWEIMGLGCFQWFAILFIEWWVGVALAPAVAMSIGGVMIRLAGLVSVGSMLDIDVFRSQGSPRSSGAWGVRTMAVHVVVGIVIRARSVTTHSQSHQ